MTIISQYASNVGVLVVNLASKGYIIKLTMESDIFNKKNLVLQVSEIKKGVHKTMKHLITETEMQAISDPAVIADAIVERLRKST